MGWGDHNKGGGGPWGSAPPPGEQPPDFDQVFKEGKERFSKFFSGKNFPGAFMLIMLIVVVGLIAESVYVVDADEQGVVLRFGKFHRTEDPGLHLRFPRPVEKIIKVPVTKINRVEVGLRTSTSSRQRVTERKIMEESLMLTGDENIVDIDFEVQWKIKDAASYLFNVMDPEETVKMVSESAMREVVGRTAIAEIFTTGRLRVESEVAEIIQSVLDVYGTGISIERIQMGEAQPPPEAIDAFRDVKTASADMDRMINEAKAYRNDIIPRARGEAARVLQEAEAYQQEVIARAEGEAKRFVSVYNQYRSAKEVTKKRMYLETMEEILGGMEKILIDSSASNSGVVPYLPLSEVGKRR